MTGDQDRPTGVRPGTQKLTQPVHASWVEAIGGLIQNEDPGIAEQRACQHQPLTHAKREAANPPSCRISKLHLLKHFIDATRRDPIRVSEDAQMVACRPPGMEAGGF